MLVRNPQRSSSPSARRFVAAAAACAVLLAGCGKSDGGLQGTIVKDGLGCKLTQTERKAGDVPTVAKVAKAPTKLVKKDLTKGKGCPADTVGYLSLDLVGATATDGKVFTSTWTEQRPITVKLGQAQLIQGLEKGLGGMKVGGRRQISVPAKEGYGSSGNAAQGIGKDQALIFVVDLVGVTDTPLYCNKAAPLPKGKKPGKPTTIDMPVEAPTTIVKKDLKVGTGKVAKTGMFLTVEYAGVACSNGKQFDSSWDGTEPFTLTLGEGTIAGFSAGIAGMKAGGLRQIEIPGDKAYGAAGKPPDIGANDPLVFVVQLTSVAAKAPASTTTTAPGASTTTTAPAAGGTTTTAAGGTTTTAPAATTSTTAATSTTTAPGTTTTGP
jgi:peptidylprolyl isomerase